MEDLQKDLLLIKIAIAYAPLDTKVKTAQLKHHVYQEQTIKHVKTKEQQQEQSCRATVLVTVKRLTTKVLTARIKSHAQLDLREENAKIMELLEVSQPIMIATVYVIMAMKVSTAKLSLLVQVLLMANNVSMKDL